MNVSVIAFEVHSLHRATITVVAGNEKIISGVDANGFNGDTRNKIQYLNFESHRLCVAIDTFGFARRLVHDCCQTIRGEGRPLPWDYGDFPEAGHPV